MIERVIKALMDRGLVAEPSELQQTSFDLVEPRVARSLADEALLVGLDPDEGKLAFEADWAVRAALMVELRLEGRIEVTGSGRKASVTVRDPHGLGDPDLDAALRGLNTGGAKKVISAAGYLHGERDVVKRLLGERALVEESSLRFGLLAVHRLLPTRAAHREELVDRVLSVLRGGSVPDERTVLLVAVIDSFVPYDRFVPKAEVKALRRAGEAVAAQVDEDDRVLLDAVAYARGRERSTTT